MTQTVNNKRNVSKGGISLEMGRGYRGSVNVNGKRHRTRHHASRSAAQRALNSLRRELLTNNR